MKSYYKSFITRKKVFFEKIKLQYEQSVLKARDKKLAHTKFYYDHVDKNYRVVQNDLGLHSRILIESGDEFSLGESSSIAQSFNKRLAEVDKRENVIDLLAKLSGLDEFHKFWAKRDSAFRPLNPKTHQPQENFHFKWLGENITEFIQLVYALHEAGLIANEENTKTGLVKQLASMFNLKLSPHWESNFSKSINERKAGYQPQIFDRLKVAFARHQEVKLKKNKEK